MSPSSIAQWLEDAPVWLAGLNDVSAIPLQILGFGIAIWQIVKAKKESTKARTAADAATAAIASTRRSMLLGQAESLIPQLVRREEMLEQAVRHGELEEILEGMRHWRSDASRLAAVLSGVAPLGASAVPLLKASARKAGEVRRALIQEDPAESIADKVREQVAAVLNSVGEATTELPDLEQVVSESRFAGGVERPIAQAFGVGGDQPTPALTQG